MKYNTSDNEAKRILHEGIVEVKMQDFIQLLTIAHAGWQPNRPQHVAEQWLSKLKEIALSYGINWMGRLSKGPTL